MQNVVEEIPSELKHVAEAALAWINQEHGAQFKLTGLVDPDKVMGRLDGTFEVSQNDVQFQKVWSATIAAVLFYLQKQGMATTDLTALRELAQALSNSAAGGRETRLNYPWSGSRGDKPYSILDEDKRARAIVTLENSDHEERKTTFSSVAKYLGKTEAQTKTLYKNFRNNLLASAALDALVNLYRKRFKQQEPLGLLE